MALKKTKQTVKEPREMRLEKALIEVANVLGTGACSDNKCMGCSYEMGEAAHAARKALGGKWVLEYRRMLERKRKHVRSGRSRKK